ncbi:MAG: MmcQ/YjbR family DNA-binding protein [Flavobacteriaceae bacterium]|nr:MmcQ/YjbR family DNA-binding protein [Flavobacteriaceae bacterium]
MNIEQLRAYCMSKKAATESFPFDENTLVFKVMNKMFALVPLENWERGEDTISLKCNPDRSLELRENYESIYMGAYIKNNHWNTVSLFAGEIKDEFLIELIDHSYDMVVKNMTKKLREELQNL